MKLSNAIEGYILAKTGYLSNRTIDDYQYYLQLWLTQQGDFPLESLTTRDLHKFFTWLARSYKTKYKKPLGQSGQHHAWVAIRAFYTWAKTELGCDNISQSIPAPALPEKPVIPYSRKEIESLLQHIKYSAWVKDDSRKRHRYIRPEAKRDRALIMVLLDTGIRVSELCHLGINDVDIAARSLEVKARGSGVKSRPRVIPLTSRTCSAIWQYITERKEAGEVFTRDSVLFINNKTGATLTRMGVYHLLQRLGERAGVDDCRPHRFRHTFAIEYLRGGGNPWMLKHILGHSTIGMVNRYLHFVSEDFQEVHQRVSAVERWRL